MKYLYEFKKNSTLCPQLNSKRESMKLNFFDLVPFD